MNHPFEIGGFYNNERFLDVRFRVLATPVETREDVYLLVSWFTKRGLFLGQDQIIVLNRYFEDYTQC